MSKTIIAVGEEAIPLFERCGNHVEILPTARIINPQNLSVGDYVRIDDFTIINCGPGSKFKGFNHIASAVKITGGGSVVLEPFACCSASSRILTATACFDGSQLMGPMVPPEFRKAKVTGPVTLGRHACIGVNSVVMPGVWLDDYSATGAFTFVNRHTLQGWLYVGIPAKKHSPRDVSNIIRLEKKLNETVDWTEI